MRSTTNKAARSASEAPAAGGVAAADGPVLSTPLRRGSHKQLPSCNNALVQVRRYVEDISLVQRKVRNGRWGGSPALRARGIARPGLLLGKLSRTGAA